MGQTGPMIVDPAPVFAAIQPDKMDAEIIEPTEELSDTILFIVNNLAPSNFDAKLTEMRDYLTIRMRGGSPTIWSTNGLAQNPTTIDSISAFWMPLKNQN